MKVVKKNRTMLFAVCVLGLFVFGANVFAQNLTNVNVSKTDEVTPSFTLVNKTADAETNRHLISTNAPEKTPKLTQEQIEAIAIQPAKARSAESVLLPFFTPSSFTYNAGKKYKGKTVKFRLHLPEKMEAGKKYPLILWLHGAGETGDDNQAQLVHLHHIITYLTGEKKRDFFLLVPQAPNDHATWENRSFTIGLSEKSIERVAQFTQKEKDEYLKKHTANMLGAGVPVNASYVEEDGKIVGYRITEDIADSPFGYVFEALDQVMRHFPVDRDRVTVSGLSTGGDGTWRALEARPDLFAAAVPLVSWSALRDNEIAAKPVLKKIPIWAIYSSDDNGIDSARADFERVAKAGCNVKKSEFGVCGHNAWTPAMLQADIFSWLLSRAKKDGEYVAVTDAKVNPDDLRGIVEVATRDTRRPTLAPTPPKPVQQKSDSKNTIQTIITKDGKTITMVTADANEKTKSTSIHKTPKPAAKVLEYSDPKVLEAIDGMYYDLAWRYFVEAASDNKNPNQPELIAGFERNLAKMSNKGQMKFFQPGRIADIKNRELMMICERCVDRLASELAKAPAPAAIFRDNSFPPKASELAKAPAPAAVVAKNVNAPKFVEKHGDAELQFTGKIIEDCDRPWAMTSDSFYGMFPADWGEEAKQLPEFVVNLPESELAKRLAKSISGDAKDFLAACLSINSLKNKPMSSPWFEVEGGRLKSDIKYKLSAKGNMFVRLLNTVKDSNSNSEKTKKLAETANKTLEKITFILESPTPTPTPTTR
ncbi:MAG: hypothetical protein LBT09_16140 [Planctomycetaceae bacterium]|nr:hypothetical protein [Planctomycetaceae bacterium]